MRLEGRPFALAMLLATAAALAPSAVSLAQSPSGQRRHALSLVEPPKFPPDFRHFDWVNPDAPKGGVVQLWALGTFDSLNPFSIKGQVALTPDSLTLLNHSQLMMDSPDEPSVEYCLICDWVSHPDDFSSATFHLREGATFSDGRPITPEDVVFSLDALKKAHPKKAAYYHNVVKAEKTGEREVTFRFDQAGNRELPTIVGQLPILARHFWEGRDANGQQRDLANATLEIPVASGPYRVKIVDPGRAILFERLPDWWARDLPVAKGQWNFDQLRYTYFRDKTPAFEAFKVGQIDFWRETSAKEWATAFTFDAVKTGKVKKEVIDTRNLAWMHGFVFNLRRAKFQDPRVRQALGYAFDFEFTNQNLFYGMYKRVDSYFGNSEMQATGLPSGRELEILKEFEKDLPPDVFTTEWKNPLNGTPAALRHNLSMASKLLAAAGYSMKGRALVDAKGEPLRIEFLETQPELERVILPFIANLEKLGIQANLRVVDSSQYQRRQTSFDFDIISDDFPQSNSPGNEQRDFWGTASADKPGSYNTAGLKSPVVDRIVDKIVYAKDRADLVAATKALDRVLLWSFLAVPKWDFAGDRIATWDMFGRPAKLPSQATSFQQVWWLDKDVAARLGPNRGK